MHGAAQTVAGRGLVAEDQVTRLLAAQAVAAGVHGFEHRAIPDRGLHQVDSRRGHRPAQAQVGHHGDDERVADQQTSLGEIHGEQRHLAIAVDEAAVAVDGDQPVAVSVEGKTQVGALFGHRGLQRRRMDRAAAVIDVAAVGVAEQLGHVRAEPAQQRGRMGCACPVRTVDNEAESGEAAPLDGLAQRGLVGRQRTGSVAGRSRARCLSSQLRSARHLGG